MTKSIKFNHSDYCIKKSGDNKSCHQNKKGLRGIHLLQRSFIILIFPTHVLHICILLLIHYPFRVLSNVSVLSSSVFNIGLSSANLNHL